MGLQAKLWCAATLAACLLISTNDARVVSRRYGDTETGISRLQLTRATSGEIEFNTQRQQYQRNPLKTQDVQMVANTEMINKPIVVGELAQAMSANSNRREEMINKIYQNIARAAASRKNQVFTNAQFGQEENNANVNAMSAGTGPAKDVLTGGFSSRYFLPQQVSAPLGQQKPIAVTSIVPMNYQRQQNIKQGSAQQKISGRGRNEGQQTTEVTRQESKRQQMQGRVMNDERQQMQGRMMNARSQENKQQKVVVSRVQNENEQQLGRQESERKTQRTQLRGRMENNRGAVRMQMVERPRQQVNEGQNSELNQETGIKVEMNQQVINQRKQNEAENQATKAQQIEGERQLSGEMQGRREQGERQNSERLQFRQRAESQQSRQVQGGRRWSHARQHGLIQTRNQDLKTEVRQVENVQGETENKQQENYNKNNQQNEQQRGQVSTEVQVEKKIQSEGKQQESNLNQERAVQQRENSEEIRQQSEFGRAVQSASSRQLEGGNAQQRENQNNEGESDGHYQFEYYVVDPHTHDIKRQKESSDGHVVTGQYSLVQPDGMLRTVEYIANNKAGFEAKVHYSPAPKMDQNQKATSGVSFNLGKRN